MNGLLNGKGLMNLTKRSYLVLVLCAGVAWEGRSQSSTNDINPALLYYQGFLVAPQMSEADMDYLGTNYWGTGGLPARYGELVGRYDEEFSLVRQAAHSAAPCDWGIDTSIWPRTLLPHLARAKAVAVGCRSRVVWELAQGHQTEAREDLLGALVLARNVSRDGTIIGALVQIAMESITTWNVAENFGRFTPDNLEQLLRGMEAAPSRGTVAAAVTHEAALTQRALVGAIEQLRQRYPGDDAKVMAGLHDFFGAKASSEMSDFWEKLLRASGGSSEGVLHLVQEAEPLYQQLGPALNLPLPEFQSREKELAATFQGQSNPLAAECGMILRARRREARALVTLAMVRAAIEYRLHGAAGLQSVTDPAGYGPFGFRRFIFEGVDRGFQLTSALDAGGFAETLIFVETPGPAFLVGGPYAGQVRAK
jgi:hypothetical protein